MKYLRLVFLIGFFFSCSKPLQFSVQGYFFVSNPDEAMAQAENPLVLAALKGVVEGIVNTNPGQILEYIHKKDGAIIDAKIFVTYSQVATALVNHESQLYRVLWDDKYWRETAPKDNIRSYQRIFSSAGDIKIGIFYYSASECELRLDFKNRPPMGILGNPIFRKRDGRWYLMNFF